MMRVGAAALAAIAMLGALEPAVCASAQAAAGFPVVPVESEPRRSHAWAYASWILGSGLIAGSFALANRADRAYARYQDALDPATIERLYKETARYDRLSSGSLLAGEVLLATGLYLRFLRRPADSRLTISASLDRCEIGWRF